MRMKDIAVGALRSVGGRRLRQHELVHAMRHSTSALLLLLCTWAQAQPTALPVQTLLRGSTGKVGVNEKFGVARNTAELAALWGRPFDAGGPIPPRVNFDTTLVVGAVLATWPDGCTSVTITGAEELDRHIVVRYKRFKHRSDEICTLAFKTVYHFVSIPKTHLPIAFKEQVDEP